MSYTEDLGTKTEPFPLPLHWLLLLPLLLQLCLLQPLLKPQLMPTDRLAVLAGLLHENSARFSSSLRWCPRDLLSSFFAHFFCASFSASNLSDKVFGSNFSTQACLRNFSSATSARISLCKPPDILLSASAVCASFSAQALCAILSVCTLFLRMLFARVALNASAQQALYIDTADARWIHKRVQKFSVVAHSHLCGGLRSNRKNPNGRQFLPINRAGTPFCKVGVVPPRITSAVRACNVLCKISRLTCCDCFLLRFAAHVLSCNLLHTFSRTYCSSFCSRVTCSAVCSRATCPSAHLALLYPRSHLLKHSSRATCSTCSRVSCSLRVLAPLPLHVPLGVLLCMCCQATYSPRTITQLALPVLLRILLCTCCVGSARRLATLPEGRGQAKLLQTTAIARKQPA